MLRISKKADYAVFLLGAIAREGAYPGGPAADSVVSAHEIASGCGLNKSVVANLLKDFARAGLLDSVRGLRGGYRLVREPQDVTLREILEIVEGKFELVDCISSSHEPVSATAAGKDRPAMSPSRSADRPAKDGDAHEECALLEICPSRSPMRVVHERIRDLFDGIHLAELCRLPATSAPATTSATTTSESIR